jgi:hypothetical protein
MARRLLVLLAVVVVAGSLSTTAANPGSATSGPLETVFAERSLGRVEAAVARPG